MKLPGPLSGTVRVVIPKVNIWLGCLAVGFSYAGLVTHHWLLVSVGVGSAAVMPFGVAFQWLAQWRFNRKVAHWPVSVQVMPGPDGGRIAFVTTHSGEVSSLVIPDDYDPSDDGGEWLFRQVAPDLADLIAEDNEEAE